MFASSTSPSSKRNAASSHSNSPKIVSCDLSSSDPHEDASEVSLVRLLHGQRLPQRLLGDAAARDEEVAEHVGGLLRRAGDDPPLAHEDALDDLVPLDGQGSGLAGIPQPLEDLGQGHGGEVPLNRHAFSSA